MGIQPASRVEVRLLASIGEALAIGCLLILPDDDAAKKVSDGLALRRCRVAS
jgi:hypothetical protein